MAATSLLKLAGFTNEFRYVDIAHQTRSQMQPLVSKYPLGEAGYPRHQLTSSPICAILRLSFRAVPRPSSST